MKENRLTFGCALIYTICSKESGARIRQRRRQLGYRVEELADALNVTTKSFYRWESGECSPSLDNLYALAVVLRTTMDDLLVGNREFVDSCTAWNVHRSGAAGGRSCNSDDSCGSSGQTFRAVLGLLQLLKIQKKTPAAFCSRRLFSEQCLRKAHLTSAPRVESGACRRICGHHHRRQSETLPE